jgi:riboflavin kinase/FMN adenylyltransferase
MSARARLLREAGAEGVEIVGSSQQMLRTPAEQWMLELVRRFNALAVVEGGDFRFGRDRLGDAAMLRRLGEEAGFDVRILEPVSVTLHDRSRIAAGSTAARWLLKQGRVADAERVLGRPWSITARVAAGERRGGELGFPTANLDHEAEGELLMPAEGVYAAEARLDDGRERPAALSVGTKPTFQGRRLTLEAHLLDLDEDLYDRRLEVAPAFWLRGQTRFPGVDALKRQLERDVERVRDWARRRLPAAAS